MRQWRTEPDNWREESAWKQHLRAPSRKPGAGTTSARRTLVSRDFCGAATLEAESCSPRAGGGPGRCGPSAALGPTPAYRRGGDTNWLPRPPTGNGRQRAVPSRISVTWSRDWWGRATVVAGHCSTMIRSRRGPTTGVPWSLWSERANGSHSSLAPIGPGARGEPHTWRRCCAPPTSMSAVPSSTIPISIS